MNKQEKEYALIVLNIEKQRLILINENARSSTGLIKLRAIKKAIVFFENSTVREKKDDLIEDFKKEEILRINNAIKATQNGRNSTNKR